MGKEEYVELIQDLCDELELGEPAELLERGLLQVDDTLIGVQYLEERDEVRLMVDLGAFVDGVDPGALHRLLLEANLNNTSFCLPTFSLHPDSGHPVVSYHLPMQALEDEAVDLADVLKDQLIPMLDEWRYVLSDALDADADSAATPAPRPDALA